MCADWRPERVEQSSGVLGHVHQRVRRRRCGLAAEQGAEVRSPALVEVGGHPDVAVVEPDHVESVVGELVAEPFVPAEHLGGEPRDEQQGWVGGVSEGLVGQFQSADGHPVGPVSRGRCSRGRDEGGVGHAGGCSRRWAGTPMSRLRILPVAPLGSLSASQT